MKSLVERPNPLELVGVSESTPPELVVIGADVVPLVPLAAGLAALPVVSKPAENGVNGVKLIELVMFVLLSRPNVEGGGSPARVPCERPGGCRGFRADRWCRLGRVSRTVASPRSTTRRVAGDGFISVANPLALAMATVGPSAGTGTVAAARGPAGRLEGTAA